MEEVKSEMLKLFTRFETKRWRWSVSLVVQSRDLAQARAWACQRLISLIDSIKLNTHSLMTFQHVVWMVRPSSHFKNDCCLQIM